jgi:UDP-N-acetylmuramoylalanine--D-glutamate ligase
MKTNWKDTRVLILGAARQGLALARWLSVHGARVTVSDLRREDDLRLARESLAEYRIDWRLDGHPPELLDSIDVLCLSGGVPLTLPIVADAVRRGIPLSNDSQIFMEVVPCKTIGITGSAGKTTTTTLVGGMAKIAAAERGRRSYTGGNIGDPLLNYVDEMEPEDTAVLEFSSFQLDQMTISPNVAAILNVTPNHLDRHGTMEAYTAAKARILQFQSQEDAAVLGRDDPGAWGLRDKVRGRLFTFSLRDLDEGLDGAYLHDGLLNLRDGHAYLPLIPRERIQVRGDHNVLNTLAAFTIGHAAGFPLDAMLEAVEEFRGVPHRLEFVRELRGARWYNDSIATAPERSIAAIHAFEEPLVLLLGGRDKDLPWEDLIQLAANRVDHLVIFGEAAEKIQKTMIRLGLGKPALTTGGSVETTRFSVSHAKGLREAVLLAADVAEPGDVVLLAPGGTSFDEFRDFAERGERFSVWVQELS